MRVAIVGIGSTPYGRHELQGRELMVEASLAALEDAGIVGGQDDPSDRRGANVSGGACCPESVPSKRALPQASNLPGGPYSGPAGRHDELDAAFFGNAFGVAEKQGHLGPLVMSALGMPEVPATVVETACASGATAMHHGVQMVAGGFAERVLVGGVERVSLLDTLTATTYFAYGSDFSYEGGSGCSFPGLYATMARSYFHEYGAGAADLAAVAVKNHENAFTNPRAHLRKRITVDDVLSSMMVADPLRLYDACPFSDGAAAAVLVPEKDARHYTDCPIVVEASARSGSVAALQNRASLTTIPGSVRAGRVAMDQANVQPRQIDGWEVHDCFTIAEVIATEDLGIFDPGNGWRGAVDGATSYDGDFPVNASGGLKAKGHPVGATGAGQVVEAVEQLRGTAHRQIAGAERMMTHNVGATGGTVVCHILGRC